jgi:hypothetical protein
MKPLHFIFVLKSLICCSLSFGQQIADTSFHYPVKSPVYNKGTGTVITIDEAHNNFHTLSGRYYAFGQLLQTDGYILRSGHEPFTSSYLSTIKILVIANALPDTGEWKLPAKPAFSGNEIFELQKWVSAGGSLFLIADHMPFPGAAEQLAHSFGFNFTNGFAFRKDEGPEFFSRKQNTLTANPITNGRNKPEQVDSIMIFTGGAFIAPENATVISRLSDDYKILLPSVAWEFNEATPGISGRGFVNGAFVEVEKGRVVIMGEAAMFSAQLAGQQKNKIGMNHPDARQNPQFLLNIIHWLDRKL